MGKLTTFLYAANIAGLVLLAVLMLTGKVPLRYNIRNLSLRWKTTAMTAIAFTLVIGLLTVMLAFVSGMHKLTVSSGVPGNVMILGEGATDESFSTLGFSDIGEIESQPGIRRDGDRPMCSRETYLIVNQPIKNPKPGRPNRRFLQVRGLDDAVMSGKVHALPLISGEWFSEAGVQDGDGDNSQSLIQSVLGEGVARILGSDRTESEKLAAKNPERLDTGDRFELGGRSWIVTGILKSNGSTFDSEVWAKRSLVGPLFGKNAYSSLVLRAPDAEGAQTLKKYFNNEYKKASLAALVETEYFEGLSETNKQFTFAIAFVAVFMALGGMFGVMNTMFAAISQRKTDIGVLRLLGYSRSQVLISFLVESVVIALIGGALGLLLGSLSHGYSATSIVGSGQGGGKTVVLALEINHLIFAAGALLTIVMGFLGGLIPSFSAMGLKPLDALR